LLRPAAPPVKRFRDQTGQAFVLLAVVLVVLLGAAALVLDVGYAFYVQRSLQASADAAALAGASQLPDPAAAESVALEYSGSTAGKNKRDNVPDVTTTVKTKCVPLAPCQPVNALVVTETTEVPTRFARILGIDSFDVTVRATACSPCGSKPLDVLLVLDRTGSMCQDSSGAPDPSCTDLNNAREGMKTFLQYMDPETDLVGLAVLPPRRSFQTGCATPASNNYNFTSSKYLLVPLSNDYSDGSGNLNYSSNLVSTIECQKGGGTTAYANAIEVADAELAANGRDEAQDVIVFLSDGAANTGPTYYPSSSSYRRQPCHQGVWSAGTAKTRGTLIYSIGYDLDAVGGGANQCQSYTGAPESPAITAVSAMQQIATDSTTFFNKPDPGQLETIYSTIAAEITGASLIPD
jgi:Putative Flp pilus-assembly TadE/G-like/von Willebrand factor type A domain